MTMGVVPLAFWELPYVQMVGNSSLRKASFILLLKDRRVILPVLFQS